jgi:hypothetical protein
MGSLSERLAQGRLDATTFRLQQDIVRRLDAQIAELESEDGVRGAIDNTGTPSTEADEEPLWSMPLVRQLHEIVEISQGIDDRLMRVTIGG